MLTEIVAGLFIIYIIFAIYVFSTTTARVTRLNEKLKTHLTNLSQRHLELTRSPRFDSPMFDSPRFDPPQFDSPRFDPPPMIQYQVGAPDALQRNLTFYTPVENRYDNRWQKVGVAISVSTTDDTVYNFEQRLAFPFTDDNFEYRAFDTDKNIHFNIPSLSGKKLYNGNKFTIPGKESIGEFELIRDTEYRMIRL